MSAVLRAVKIMAGLESLSHGRDGARCVAYRGHVKGQCRPVSTHGAVSTGVVHGRRGVVKGKQRRLLPTPLTHGEQPCTPLAISFTERR